MKAYDILGFAGRLLSIQISATAILFGLNRLHRRTRDLIIISIVTTCTWCVYLGFFEYNKAVSSVLGIASTFLTTFTIIRMLLKGGDFK